MNAFVLNPICAVNPLNSQRDFVFFLTWHKDLVVVDADTGAEVALIQFEPVVPLPVEGGRFYRQYIVVADGDRFFVYLGDSRQLFAFEVTD